jgi:Na+/H+ antiporter NhaD/arsenite permease-like protein
LNDLLNSSIDFTQLLLFTVVYLAMLMGSLPGLAIDRTGAAILGAIAVVVAGRLTPPAAWQAIDTPTIGLLLGLMLISAQLRLAGFYDRFTRWLAECPVTPNRLLALVVLSAGVLSALLCNDIICLAMAPMLAQGCVNRRLNPVPFLLALACAANIGSATTLIGNPQNMLIGQRLHLDFGRFLLQALPPTLTGLVTVWAFLAWRYRGRWEQAAGHAVAWPSTDYLRGQTWKGLAVLALVVLGMLTTQVPREVLALAGGGFLLMNRRFHSRDLLALLDWPVLLLFAGLFIVNEATVRSGILAAMMESLRATGLEPSQPATLFCLSVLLSNLVSNVPATMLLLPLAEHPLAGPVLALSSTFAGNLLIVGSIANIIVVDQAERQGVRIGWAEHARVGIPVTLLSLAQAALWLWLLQRYAPEPLVFPAA